MNGWFHSWRAAVRIARRDAWRSKGRSFLVLAMIALPILGVSAADLTLRSAELSPQERATRLLGAADARVSDPGYGGVPVQQSPDGQMTTPADKEYDTQPVPEGHIDVKKALPAGATLLEDTNGYGKLRTAHGLLHTGIRELKAADPLAEGILTPLDGRFPQRPDEVAASSRFLEESGLEIGGTLAARGLEREYRIVGSYEVPDDLRALQVNALPGAFLEPLRKGLEASGMAVPDISTEHLVKLPADGGHGFTWNMVQETNAKGAVVVSRAVLVDPPANADVPIFQREGYTPFDQSLSADKSALVAVATVVGLAMLEICLLAGPAFAVGARRSRRQLGLVGANGGDRRHIRAIVLAGGLVIGVAAAVVGTVLGLILTFVLQPVLEDSFGQRFGAFDVRPLELLGIGALAVLTGLLAAVVPAVTASRETVLASLTGRRGIRRSNRVLPVIGLVAALLGASIALYGSVFSDQFVIVAGGSALAELGVVAMTPALVGMFGRVGRWLPLSPRLALRDSVRNRGRTAPAVAAVLAAVAGTVAVATYATSEDAQLRAKYEAQLPYGAVSALTVEDGGRDVPAIREAVQRHVPVEVRADVARIAVGRAGCGPFSAEAGCGRSEVVIPKANECPLWAESAPPGTDPAERFSKEERRRLADDWRCRPGGGGYVPTVDGLLVADAALLKVLGVDDPAAEKALAEGRVVSFHKKQVDAAGRISLRVVTDAKAADEAVERNEPVPGEVKALPAYQVPDGTASYGVAGVLTPAAAEAAGLGTVPMGSYYSTDHLPGSEQRQRLDDDLAKVGSEVHLHVETGYDSENSIVLLALTVFAGLITIGAAGIATGLAQADAEADLKTLAAVGAPPRVRRTLSGFQCGVVAVMGVLLGTAAGVLPAIGLRLTERRQQERWYQEGRDAGWAGVADLPHVPIVIPWETFGALLVAVPLGAALLAALLTRSRTAVARRTAA
ncbi:FtsX-like permease family protein [Streptomyces sp. TRM76323]|uniref:FtsX-like permease family protein n=1 Tax=Streptomyces tamarix TaxID=3078565 RepID=A0ABU3QGU1_9ACTN|nr:FtsX-like permease family protein [Streptomyces tamarix]MDT9681969.1 FtsX-like permease family protein [Streptomyces tamarix]